jgi:uncharacterized membrane protein
MAPRDLLESERIRMRVTSVDIVRGVVMVLMALDHVRVYSGVPAGGPAPGVFLTRWVTHFCAPAFFFLAGASAFLRGPGPSDAPSLPRWLVTRGALLVLLELTLIRFGWTFNFDYAHSILAGVIWALGWSMILLAAVARLPIAAIATIGLVLIAGHDLVPILLGAKREEVLGGALGPLLRIVYFGGGIPLGASGEPYLFVLYSIVPWWGVMCAGFALGSVLRRPPVERSRWCLRAGMIATALFLVLRALELYGDRPWRPAAGEQAWAPAWIMFLATTKYPASLQFLLMTLGPTLVALGLLERAQGWGSRALMVFGRVPMFFYLLHIPLIHGLALAVAAIRTPQAIGWLFANHPVMPPPVPDGYRWPLPLLYAITAVAVGLLYPLCRAYDRGKATGRWKWARYI